MISSPELSQLSTWRTYRNQSDNSSMTEASLDAEVGYVFSCFFFQAEDGIRDYKVTGVQTCALPIYGLGHALVADFLVALDMQVRLRLLGRLGLEVLLELRIADGNAIPVVLAIGGDGQAHRGGVGVLRLGGGGGAIGRGLCGGRGLILGVGGFFKK